MVKISPYRLGLFVRKSLFAGLSVVLGLTIAFLIVSGTEWALHELQLTPFKDSSYWHSSEPPPTLGPPPKTHIKVNLPDKLEHSKYTQTNILPFRSANYPPGYYIQDDSTGPRMRPGFTGYVQQLRETGELNYSVLYQIDSEGRRFTPGQSDPARKNLLLFLGCSYTVGEGLNPDETLAARVAALQPNIRAFNYGVHGWGPGNLLRWAQKPDFARDLPRGIKTNIIYLFMNHHLYRVNGSLNIYRAGFNWQHRLPYYFLDKDGLLQTNGMLDDGRPWTNWLYTKLADSEILKFFAIEVPPRVTVDQLKIFTAILVELRKVLREKLPGAEFYVAFYPDSSSARQLIPMLDQVGIPSLDYSGIHLTDYLESPADLPDGHPSAATNDFLARQVLTDLDLFR